jgi:RNA polymerase sigma-70 factor (ECF subfamily)
MTIPEQSVEEAFLAYRKDRDPAALAAVYDGTSSRMLAVALHLASSANAAEDAVQDTFLFALEHPERWDETRPLVPWLLGILVNRLRQSAYRANRTPDPGRIAQPDVPDPSSELQASELLTRIDDAITHLPQPYRTVVLLRLRNGLEPADIAVALDRKPSTVRAQLTRGVEMLRKVLPAGVAGLILGTLALPRGLTAAREVVLKRAAEVQRALEMQAPLATLKLWLFGTGGVLAIAALIWALVLARSDPELPEPIDELFGVVTETQSEVRELPLPTPAAPPSSARVEAAGSTVVRVLRRDRGMPFAAVEIEPLGDPPQAFVHATSTTRGSWRDIVPALPNPPALVRRATTGNDGACVFNRLPPGIWVGRALGVCTVFEVRAGSAGEVRLTVEPGSRLVRGIALDGDGLPLVGARVWTCQEHRNRVRRFVTACDEAGRFQLAVAPSTTVGVVAAGLAPVAVAVGRLADMPPLDVRMVLEQPGASIRGRVVDAAGRPVAGAVVQVGHSRDAKVRSWPQQPQVVARATRVVTDDDGRFTCVGLVPGAVRLRAFTPDAGVCSEVVQLAAGGEATPELRLRGTGSVQGVVTGADGRPLAGAMVRVGRRGAVDHRSCVSGADGSFRLSGVPVGDVRIEACDYRDGFASTVLEVVAGQAAQWSPTFTAEDLVLRGRLQTPGGQPFAAWIVHRGRIGTRVLRTDGDGRFAVPVSEREAALEQSVFVYLEDPRNARGHVQGTPHTGARDLRVGSEAVLTVPPRADYRGPRLRKLVGGEHPVHMAIVWPDGAAGDESVDLEVFDADGALLHRSIYRGGRFNQEGPYVLLPFGTFRVEARTASGLAATVVTGFGPQAPQLRAVLLPLR